MIIISQSLAFFLLSLQATIKVACFHVSGHPFIKCHKTLIKIGCLDSKKQTFVASTLNSNVKQIKDYYSKILSNFSEIRHFDKEIATVLHYPSSSSRQRQLGAAQQ